MSRVMDLSRPPSSPRLIVEPSEAAELLMSVIAVLDESDHETYDLGVTRLAEINAAVAPDLMNDMLRLFGSDAKFVGHLLGLVLEAPGRDAKSFFTTVEATDPRELLLVWLGYYFRQGHTEVDPADVAAAVDGDAVARERLIKAEEDWEPWEPAVANLLELGGVEVKRLLLAALPRWHSEVFTPLATEGMPIIERDVVARQAEAQSMQPERFIEVATNGVKQVREQGVRRYVLWPTYWLKPWIIAIDHKDARVFVYSVADESIENESDAPPAGLVKLYKALGDEGRLRVLRRLSKEPLSLAEAAEEMGVAKSTAHHHMSLLRQAGLVWIQDEEGSKQFGLRKDLIPRASELLQNYLG